MVTGQGLPQIRKKQWEIGRCTCGQRPISQDLGWIISHSFAQKPLNQGQIIKPGSMQFSTAGLGWEVLDGADADGSSVAPLIGSTQTGLYTAATIWFGSIASFFINRYLFGIFHAGPSLTMSA